MQDNAAGDISSIIGGDFDPSKYIGKKAYVSLDPPRVGAIKIMQEHGLKPPHTFGIGQLFRFPDSQDKKGKNSGWAVYHEYKVGDEILGTCTFGSFHDSGECPSQVTWSNKRPDYMTAAEKSEFNQRIEHAKKVYDETKLKQNEAAAEDCKRIWEAAKPFESTVYTLKKNIIAKGARLHNNISVLLPIMGPNGVMSLQYISEDGSKKFHDGGKIKAGYMLIEGKGEEAYVTEGWATACSIAEATEAHVYVAFSANNITNVAALANEKFSRVIIATDDDRFTTGNPGIKASMAASNMHSCEIVYPIFKSETEGTDFNDMHAQLGIEAVAAALIIAKPIEIKEEKRLAVDTSAPPGVLDDMYKYYMATSGNHQPGFALQTALAMSSVICGRYFTTDEENRTTLYFLNVGKSATGKEHAKAVIDRVFYDAGLEHLIAGDGFTSAGAVMSLLLAKPRAITCVDEFGRYLAAASANGNTGQREANTTLMEVIGRPNGVLRPKNYSAMTLKKDQAEEMRDRYIYNPSLTLLGMTTPVTFFDQIKLRSVLDGFLGRFIVSVSDEERAPRKKASMVETPEAIINWVDAINERVKSENPIEAAQSMPSVETIYFSNEATTVQKEFEIEMIKLQNSLDKVKLGELPGRCNEFAMRMSLICALSRDPKTFEITQHDMQWSVNYVRASIERLLQEVKDNVSETFVDAGKKELLIAIRGRGTDGITKAQMQVTQPFSKYSAKELNEYLGALEEAELIQKEGKKSPGRGRPGFLYYALYNK